MPAPINPESYFSTLINMFYDDTKSYITRISLGKLILSEDEEILTKVDSLVRTMEKKYGRTIFEIEIMAFSSNDLKGFIELDDGENVCILQVRKDLAELIFKISDSVNRTIRL